VQVNALNQFSVVCCPEWDKRLGFKTYLVTFF